MPSLAQARQSAEQRAIADALGRAGGNRERAAKLLRISPATLYRKLGQRPPSLS
jgi:transcriptional regulator with PAS, ATPase and Fis domain